VLEGLVGDLAAAKLLGDGVRAPFAEIDRHAGGLLPSASLHVVENVFREDHG
jgi:hypothetical protein